MWNVGDIIILSRGGGWSRENSSFLKRDESRLLCLLPLNSHSEVNLVFRILNEWPKAFASDSTK